VSLAALRSDLEGIACEDDPALVRQKSRDFFWYSPPLKARLNRMTAELVVSPRSEEEVVRVLTACARHRVAVTPRGGGTGNYGQAVPLQGGVLLDMTGLSAIEWQRPGVVRVQCGAKMVDIDAALQPGGWELRMHPSTKRTATIGGFVAGGSGGIGSIAYGGLLDAGNVLAARVVTAEETPRVLELRDADTAKVNHAYGTTGIITALEMPTGPAWPWVDVVVAFDDLEQVLRAGLAVAHADGVVKKLLTTVEWPIPSHFRGLTDVCPEGCAMLLGMIAEPSLAAFRQMVAGFGGRVTLAEVASEGGARTPVYEYTWNHTTLNVLRTLKTVTYLQSMFPPDGILERVAKVKALFGDELWHHFEIIRFRGRVTISGLPIVQYTTEERLNEIIGMYEARGVSIANPHVWTLEDGSAHKRANADQVGFKGETDPFGLLNPGKMRSFQPAA
jgi:FAD binding domain